MNWGKQLKIKSLASDLSAVTQKRVSTSTKFLEISCKLVKKPTQNELQKQPPEVFLEISKNSQENTCARVSFLIKLQA